MKSMSLLSLFIEYAMIQERFYVFTFIPQAALGDVNY